MLKHLHFQIQKSLKIIRVILCNIIIELTITELFSLCSDISFVNK